jgi:hypothetical protein
MVEKVIMPGRNIIDFARYQQGRTAALSARTCRHCGAALLDGEREDECSSAMNIDASDTRGNTRKFRAD